MASILQYVSQGESANLNVPGAGGSPLLNPRNFQTGEYEALASIAGTVSQMSLGVGNAYASIQRKREARDNTLWVQQAANAATQDWIRWMKDPANRSGDRFDEDFIAGVDNTIMQVGEDAPTPEALQSFTARMEAFKLSALPSIASQTALTRTLKTQAAIEYDIQALSDSLPFLDDPGMLEVGQQQLAITINEHVQQNSISAKTGEQMKRQLSDLTLTYGISLIGKDNELARETIRNAKNVDPNRRQAALAKVEAAVKSFDAGEKVKLKTAAQSDLVETRLYGGGSQLGATGLAQYEVAFGKEAADKLKRELDSAARVYDAQERLEGVQPSEYQTILEEFDVQRLSGVPVNEQAATQQEVMRLVARNLELYNKDPFQYFMQQPYSRELASQIENASSPEDKALLQARLRDHILSQQEASGIPAYAQKVMTNAEAEDWAMRINQSVPLPGTEGSINTLDILDQMRQEYPDDSFFKAYRQLNDLPSGRGVKPELLSALGFRDNPYMFKAVVEAIRKNPTEQMAQLGADGSKRAFEEDVATNKLFQQYRASFVQADNSPLAQELMTGTFNAFKAYARDAFLTGIGVEESAKQFFGARYDFGDVNGRSYAIAKTYRNEDGSVATFSDTQLDNIKRNLDWALRRTSNWGPEQRRQLDLLGVPMDQLVDPSATEAQKKYFFNQLASTAFWATNAEETGVELFVRGDSYGAIERVRTLDGRGVELRFIDIADMAAPGTTSLVDSTRVLSPRGEDRKWYHKVGDALSAIAGS